MVWVGHGCPMLCVNHDHVNACGCMRDLRIVVVI